LSSFVVAPQELARRLAQIGIVDRAQGPQLAKHLKTGQRLVSVEGDLWRWDGFAAAAHAPTGAARRLAERNRLAEIETELDDARLDLEEKRNAVEAARQAVQDAAAAESAARSANRDRQHDANAARDRHDAAERELNRHAARLSALTEASARLTATRDEAVAARSETEAALTDLPPALDLETRLTEVREEIAVRRSTLAEVRAEAQAIAREAELADRRLQAIGADQTEWTTR
jgi:chromosome segregation protein